MEWEGVGMAKRCLGCPCFPRIGWEGFQKGRTNHEKGLGASWFPSVGWEWFVNSNMKHEKGVRYFVVPKSGVGRAWEGSK